jgi:purine-nucleoside phosphorylase
MNSAADLSDFRNRTHVAVVLGSGLSAVMRFAQRIKTVPYTAIPGLAATTVEGHPGALSLCRIDRLHFLLFAGRFHLYEGAGAGSAERLVSLAGELGCKRMLITQAAGSLRPDLPVGSWMLPLDIVSLPLRRPCAPPAPGRVRAAAERPPDGRRIISPRFRRTVRRAALDAGVDLHEGILLFSVGPAYETSAEARAGVLLGADAATMSSLPELAAACAAGIEPVLLSWITNQTANLSGRGIEHGEVVRRGDAGARFLLEILAHLPVGN